MFLFCSKERIFSLSTTAGFLFKKLLCIDQMFTWNTKQFWAEQFSVIIHFQSGLPSIFLSTTFSLSYTHTYFCFYVFLCIFLSYCFYLQKIFNIFYWTSLYNDYLDLVINSSRPGWQEFALYNSSYRIII